MTSAIQVQSAPEFVAEAHTPEWHSARLTGIGASEIAAVCGLSRWDSPLSIYAKKLGLVAPTVDNAAMRLGRKLEPIVISEFCAATEHEVDQAPCPMLRHPEYPFILATPDAVLKSGDLLEAKTTTWRGAKLIGDEGTDFVADEIVMQAQQQLAVTGRNLCYVATLVDGRELLVNHVERNPNLIALMIDAAHELWERIQDRRPPEPNWEHARTADLIREMHGLAEGKTIALEEDVAALWRQQKEIAEQVKELEKARETLRAKVLHAIGDAAIALLPGEGSELRRSVVKAGHVSYERKEYVLVTERKLKGKK